MAINIATSNARPASTTKTGILSSLTAGSVAALFDQPEKLSLALAHLANAGVDTEQLQIVEATTNGSAAAKQRRGLSEWIASLGAESTVSRHYQKAVASGRTLLSVSNLSAEQRRRIASMLHSTGGRYINDFGFFTVRTVAA